MILNQVFLKPERLGFLNSLEFKPEKCIHQKVWKWIYETESACWQNIQDLLPEVLQRDLYHVLYHCTTWLETARFKNHNIRRIHHLAKVYSFFMELVMEQWNESRIEKTDADDFFLKFLYENAKNFKDKKTVESGVVAKLMGNISNWINFNEMIISPYSFDLNITPILEDEMIFLKNSPEAYYSWLLDGARYEINRVYYFLQGFAVIGELEISNRLKIPGKNIEDENANRTIACRNMATRIFLNDIGITDFQIGEISIEAERILSPLITYSSNRLDRYDNALFHLSESSSNWSEAYIKLADQSFKKYLRNEPFLFISREKYIDLNKSANESITEEDSNIILNLFSYSISKKNRFNRFHCNYDVWQHPFLIIGKHFFCPMIFFANNAWDYSFIQASLIQINKSIKIERSETTLMEKSLGERIQSKGWKVKVIDNIEAGVINGDVDIIVEDSEAVLFIQLKRTYLRLNLKDIHYETINIDKKAAKQLNDAEKYFSEMNSLNRIYKDPVKWIISTSFEFIGKRINGCLKLNYFELLKALNQPNVKTLKDLIDDLEQDKNLKRMAFSLDRTEIPQEFKQMIIGSGIPIPIFESKKYLQPIFTNDERKSTLYAEIFSQAIEYDNTGRKNEALVLLQKCISINPVDGEVWSAIANILADLKIYDQSIFCYKKALEYLPNDPFIMKNYSVTLIESGDFYEGFNLWLDIFEKYPLIEDLKFIFEKNFGECLKHGLLLGDQIVELEERWRKLN